MAPVNSILGSQPPTFFSISIRATLKPSESVTSNLHETAKHLTAAVTESTEPAVALFELWEAFFTAVVNSTGSFDQHFDLLDAIRKQPPTKPSKIRKFGAARQLQSLTSADGKLHWSTLPGFVNQCCDMHDGLEGWRDYDGVHDTLQSWPEWNGVHDSSIASDSGLVGLRSGSLGEHFLRFTTFSAKLLEHNMRRGERDTALEVFYMCKNTLERNGPQTDQPRAHRISPEQLWALDVRVAAIWLSHGGPALWEMDHDELQKGWAAALNEKTELWPREDGLTRERWILWMNRLQTLGAEAQSLDTETRAVVGRAAEVIQGLVEASCR